MFFLKYEGSYKNEIIYSFPAPKKEITRKFIDLGRIGHGEPHFWSSRIPDLDPIDFCIWGHLKTRVQEKCVIFK